MKYYIKSKDWHKICKTFEIIKKDIFLYVDSTSLDISEENYVGFSLLDQKFRTILSINDIEVIEK